MREEFAKFTKGRVIGAKAARAFVERIKSSQLPALKQFIEPHLKVVEMVKAGKSRAVIEKFWTPAKRSFTRGGGFRGFGGRLLGIVGVALDIWSMRPSMPEVGEPVPVLFDITPNSPDYRARRLEASSSV